MTFSHSRWLFLLVSVIGLLAIAPAHAADSSGGDPEAVKHSADGNYLDFSPFGEIELPRILLARDAEGGLTLDVFATTHGALEQGPYTLGDGEGGALSPAQVEAAIDEHKHLYFPMKRAQGSILVDFSLTRHTVFVFIVALLVLALMLPLAAKYKRGVGREEAPHGTWQNLMEVFIVFLRDEVTKPTIGRKWQKYFPYIATVFFFILLGNLLGLVPWGVTATSNIMVTGTLAVFTFIVTQVSGTKEYWEHTFNPPGVPVFVKPFLVPVEFIGLFTKPLALAFRLFGNMLSGHLVIVSLIGLIFIFAAQLGTGVGVGTIFISVPLTVFIYVLKLAISFIQAYIFAILSALFIGLALEEHEHVGEEHIGMPDEDDERRARIEGDGVPGQAEELQDVLDKDVSDATPMVPESAR
jgi:F-type H+-transporting ATPase subunit a